MSSGTSFSAASLLGLAQDLNTSTNDSGHERTDDRIWNSTAEIENESSREDYAQIGDEQKARHVRGARDCANHHHQHTHRIAAIDESAHHLQKDTESESNRKYAASSCRKSTSEV